MIGLQIIGITIAIVGLYMSYLHLKKNDFNKVEFTIWILVWLGFLVVTLTPTSFNFVMDAFAFDSMLDVVTVTSIMVIYIICFRNYVVGRRLEKKLEDLVREDAINTMITKDDWLCDSFWSSSSSFQEKYFY